MGTDSSKDCPSRPKKLADLGTMSKYTPGELQCWYREFTRTRPHKYITTEEFVETYLRYFPKGNADMFAENVFKLFDANHDGKIDFSELAVALGIFSRGSREEKLKWMFSLYDINGDGYIKRDEMKIILTALVRLKNNEHGGVKRSVAEIVEDQVELLFRELDVDRDGLLSLQEFTQVTETNNILLDVFEKGITKIPK